MTDWSRRSFVSFAAGAPALAFVDAIVDRREPGPGRPRRASAGGAERTEVFLSGDGLHLTPAQHAELLALLPRFAGGRQIAADEYGLGGEVAEFEGWFAKLLGKERAVFMPTGTLANHIALRVLARGRTRVIVQEVSHVYNDTGDGCQALSNLNLIPLAPGKATFTREDVERVLARTASGRVAAQVGAISIESPIRRLRGELFDHGGDDAHRVARARARHRPAPRRRAAVHGERVHAAFHRRSTRRSSTRSTSRSGSASTP